jgi:hypothetical protein
LQLGGVLLDKGLHLLQMLSSNENWKFNQ